MRITTVNKYGIQRQLSKHYFHEKNGKAENMNINILYSARALLYNAEVSKG